MDSRGRPEGLKVERLPGASTPPVPMLCHTAATVPRGPQWIYEIKFDGYRVVAMKRDGPTRLFSRNRNDITARFAPVARALDRAFARDRFIADGEVVAFGRDGRHTFAALAAEQRAELGYYIFDALELGGVNLTGKPLAARKAALRRWLKGVRPPLFLADGVEGSPKRVWAAILRGGFEGLVAKDRNGLYRPGERSPGWLKVKALQEEEFVVGGFTHHPELDRISSLLLGAFQGDRLRYVGKVGTGWDGREAARLGRVLRQMARAGTPFDRRDALRVRQAVRLAAAPEIQWVEPRLVCRIHFTHRTPEGALRHPVYLGERDDQAPEAVKFVVAAAA